MVPSSPGAPRGSEAHPQSRRTEGLLASREHYIVGREWKGSFLPRIALSGCILPRAGSDLLREPSGRRASEMKLVWPQPRHQRGGLSG